MFSISNTKSLVRSLFFSSLLFLLSVNSIASPQVTTDGGSVSAVIDTGGNLWMWGWCSNGEIPNVSCPNRFVSKPVSIGSDYSAISLGGGMLALKNDGSVWSWGGSNSYGQLGDGTTAPHLTPMKIGSGFVSISSGSQHSLAIKADGSLWAWGGNDMGQLGDGTRIQRSSPTFIGNGFVSAAAGGSFSVALKTDGTLWAWGCCSFGRDVISANSEDIVATPTQIGTGFSAISAAGHAIALKSDGSVWTFGRNIAGELGNGSDDCQGSGTLLGCARTPPFHPKLQQIGAGFIAVAASPQQSLALKQDGSLWMWGAHDGSSIYPAPTIIGGGFSAIGPGIAAKRDGSVWRWGGNLYGEIGDGTTAASYFPKAAASSDGKSSFNLNAGMATAINEAVFTAPVTAPITNLYMTASMQAASGDLGKSNALFAMAHAGDSWLCLNKVSGWQVCSASALPYDNVILGNNSIEIFSGADVSPYIGVDIYIGYGKTIYDMLANGAWQMVYRIH